MISSREPQDEMPFQILTLILLWFTENDVQIDNFVKEMSTKQDVQIDNSIKDWSKIRQLEQDIAWVEKRITTLPDPAWIQKYAFVTYDFVPKQEYSEKRLAALAKLREKNEVPF